MAGVAELDSQLLTEHKAHPFNGNPDAARENVRRISKIAAKIDKNLLIIPFVGEVVLGGKGVALKHNWAVTHFDDQYAIYDLTLPLEDYKYTRLLADSMRRFWITPDNMSSPASLLAKRALACGFWERAVGYAPTNVEYIGKEVVTSQFRGEFYRRFAFVGDKVFTLAT